MCVELRRFAPLSYLVTILWCQSKVANGVFSDQQESLFGARIILSSNPVYIGQPVTLTCNFGSQKVLIDVTVDAFKGTHREGSLTCHVADNVTHSSGVFTGSKFSGCPTFRGGSTGDQVTMTAVSSLELSYNCTVKVITIANQIQVLASEPTYLTVLVLPSIPAFISSSIIRSNSDNATIMCESSGGKPPAIICVTVTSSNGKFETTIGDGSASLTLPSPLSDWHNATAECSVTNHNFSTMTVSSDISVNYISETHDPSAICLSTSRPFPNCSSYLSNHLDVSHKLPMLPQAILGDSVRWEFGTMNCILTENNGVKIVVVVIAVSGDKSCPFVDAPTSETSRQYFYCEKNQAACYAIGFSAAIIIIFVLVFLAVLGNRGFFSRKLWPCPGLHTCAKRHGSVIINSSEEILMTENLIYARTPSDIAYESQGTGRKCNDFSANCKDHLVIAAEEAAVNFDSTQSPTTHLVEFSDRSCSLEQILAKVHQATTQTSAVKFNNVTLFLRPAENGMIVSEVDRTVLNCENLVGEIGEKMRGFLTCLANMSLNRHNGEARMSIPNYSGRDASKLARILSNIVLVPVMVTNNMYDAVQSAVEETVLNVYEEIGTLVPSADESS